MNTELLSRLEKELGAAMSNMILAKSHMEKLEAENLRMRESLKKIEVWSRSHRPDWDVKKSIGDEARAALEGK